MQYKGSIKNRLTGIILLVTSTTLIIAFSSFTYWYLQYQQTQSIRLAKTVSNVLGQDIAKLILLNDMTSAIDISTNLTSFDNLDKMVLYKLDKTIVFQYSKDKKKFKVKPLPDKKHRILKIKDHCMVIYTDATYQGTHLGYVKLKFQIKTILDILNENKNIILVLLLSLVLFSYLLTLYFAKKFTKPILDLVSYLDDIEHIQNVQEEIKIEEKNEYGKLYNVVNSMIQRIKANQEKLRLSAVAFETQNGITITDKNHTILQVNKAFTKITGYTQEDVIGKTPAILKSGIHKKEFYSNMQNSLLEKGYWNGEIQNLTKDGKILKENLTIQSVVDEKDEVLYYVASFTDITLQKEIEQKLQEKEMMLVQQSKMAAMGEMLENIAHQWRQPLSLISSISSGTLLKREYNIDIPLEEEKKHLTQINETIEYLSQTIDDFRDFFKPNKEPVYFNIKDTYRKTLKLVQNKFLTSKINVIENIEDITVQNFDNEFMQVIMNILNNAKDILETKQDQKRLIFVDIYQKENNVIITIKDNAGGIPKDIISKIFDPYFTTKHKTQGTGIGLYMSQEIIIKHMKGSIKVANETFKYENTLYTGASFTIKLPYKKDDNNDRI
jgi:PAS domain S-box-containing protein